MLMGEVGRPRAAEDAFRAALKTDPESADAAYNLCVILADDHTAEALEWCRNAKGVRPNEPKYAYTLAFYLQQSGKTKEAIAILRIMIEDHATYVDGYRLLGNLLERHGTRDEAIDVYRRASQTRELLAQARQFFQAKLSAVEQR